MKDIFILGDHIISPLGKTSGENFSRVLQNESGIRLQNNLNIHDEPFYASLIGEETLSEVENTIRNFSHYTRLEKLIIYSIQSLIQENSIELDEKTLVVLSSTKGNISLLNQEQEFSSDRIYLSVMAKEIQEYFKLKNDIIIVSNACISGSLAISVAQGLLQSSRYEKAIVVGADEIGKFVFSGFTSFQAVSPEPCKPFDKNRAGVTLGEAVASVYLSKKSGEGAVKIEGTGSYNDANHISGPSRTGEGLYRSIQMALKESGREKVDFISAHGTATLYNDEMESVALQRSGLLDVETNSFKGYYGHTLGASGILETILSIHSLKNGKLIQSLGFEEQGTTHPMNILQSNADKDIHSFLKTASGFGGSNIAAIFSKV